MNIEAWADYEKTIDMQNQEQQKRNLLQAAKAAKDLKNVQEARRFAELCKTLLAWIKDMLHTQDQGQKRARGDQKDFDVDVT